MIPPAPTSSRTVSSGASDVQKMQLTYPFEGVLILAFGNRGGGKPGIRSLGQPMSESAPSASDLEQVMLGFDLKLVDYPVVFCQGCFFECRIRGRENSARVGHGRVEHELVEVVPEIIMQGNIFAASLDGVFLAESIAPAGDLVEQGCPSAFHPIHDFLVLQEETEECDQVGGCPVPVRITVGHPERTTQAGLAEEDGILDYDFRLYSIGGAFPEEEIARGG